MDRIVTGGVLFLLFFTPLAFGSVHPWAISLMEGVIFFLVVVWMMKLLFSSYSFPLSLFSPLTLSFFLPLLLFISILLFQLVPLPPSLLHSLSPATYELYARSFLGWPEKMPYADLPSQVLDNSAMEAELASSPGVFLPTPEEVQQGAPVPLAREDPETRRPGDPEIISTSLPRRFTASHFSLWRPLSLAPTLTRIDLLKCFAYLSLFFLVLFYPFSSSRNEERFFRVVLLVVLFIGLLVAFIGVAQRFTWNGKILWFFTPYDWGSDSQVGIPRTSGPFVSPDHFANYLALIFPLALAGTISTRFFVSQVKGRAFRLFCGLALFVLLMGILLSLSRGGWIGMALGVGALLGFLLSLPEEKRPSLLRRSTRSNGRFAVAGLILLLVLILFFVGPSGRGQVDIRLEETVIHGRGLWDRVAIWQDSLGMLRDFPLFGVGLGAWQDLFPRYQRPPWIPFFYREAHNDYLELIAETGIIGFGLLAWFFWWVGRRLLRGFPLLSSKVIPVYAALVAALGSMAFHEFFDFNLQIPANAVLCTLLLAIALRLTKFGAHSSRFGVRRWFHAPVISGIGIVASVLCIVAFRQENHPSLYDLQNPSSLAEARQLLLSYPARSSTHLSLFRFLQKHTTLPNQFDRLETALWLDPMNPYARDLYAQSLLQKGEEEEGLKEITRSVFFSPLLSTHPYLGPRFIPWLSAEEQKAVEKGFQQAVMFGTPWAVGEFAAFYSVLGRFSEEGRVYEEAALPEQEADTRLDYLLNAGLAYARAGEGEKATILLQRAKGLAPQDPRAYQYLATQVFARGGDVAAAKAAVAEGIEKGADPFPLYLSLGEAAQTAKDREEAKAALQQALKLRPASFDAHWRLGLLHWQERNFDRAVLSLRRAVDANPHSALAFFYLGLAEEGRYQWSAAKQAYARAAELAPKDSGFQSHYETFLRKMAAEDKTQSTP